MSRFGPPSPRRPRQHRNDRTDLEGDDVTHRIGGATPWDTVGDEPSTACQPVYLMGAPPVTPNPNMHRRHCLP